MIQKHSGNPARRAIRTAVHRRFPRMQSAMEYLMTYGWAILIIAVILGVLFSLGVFNPTNYAPKVPAGNCHVFRPNGPGTNFNVNLVGTCSGFLPQYVAQFNGQNSYINIPTTSVIDNSTTVTASVWFKRISSTGGDAAIINIDGSDSSGYQFWMNGNNILYVQGSFSAFYLNGQVGTSGTTQIAAGQWYNLIAVFTGMSDTGYDNQIGAQCNGLGATSCAQHPAGLISNVQLYNASLNANEIQYLYNEGIGGSPVYLSHLVAWWPLNGDAKDYSGNGNDGAPYNLSYNGSWESGYSQP